MANGIMGQRALLVPQVPFCEKRFALLRLLSSAACGVCLGIICKLAFYLTAWCNKRISQQLSLAAKRHLHAAVPLVSYFTKRGAFVEFSTNLPRMIRPLRDDISALQQMYGREAIDEGLRIYTADFPMQRGQLYPLEPEVGSASFGMALHFIRRYHLRREIGDLPMQALKHAASLFTKGATFEAELAQIFRRAVDTRPRARRLRDAMIDRWRQAEPLLLGGRRDEAMAIAEDVVLDPNSHLVARIFALAKTAGDAFIAQQMHLGFETCFQGIYSENLARLDEAVDRLSSGLYLLSYESSDQTRQSVLGKIGEGIFLFDPDVGVAFYSHADLHAELRRHASCFPTVPVVVVCSKVSPLE